MLVLKLMGRVKIIINKGLLHKLYRKQNLSPYKIGDVLGCSFSTVTNRLKEYGIPLKSPAFARMRYQKFNFDNNMISKAYMVGFRLGDLNVYKPSEKSETIVVRCHTTQKVQIKVIDSLFKKFGKVSISFRSPNHYTVNCFLNNSFDFLLSKGKLSWDWVTKDCISGAPFIAGYTDAEGNFILNQNRARFKIDSYDFEILEWISNYLTQQCISNKFRKIFNEGDKQIIRGVTAIYKKDVWRLNVNEAPSLFKFISSIMPYLRHDTRIKDAQKCLRNINQRRTNGTIA